MSKKKEPVYVLAQDLIIPAGTRLLPAPTRTMHFYPQVEAILENGKDSVSIWKIDLDEGLKTGLVKES